MPPKHPAMQALANTFERSLVTMHKMPRVWLMYLQVNRRTTVTFLHSDLQMRRLQDYGCMPAQCPADGCVWTGAGQQHWLWLITALLLLLNSGRVRTCGVRWGS